MTMEPTSPETQKAADSAPESVSVARRACSRPITGTEAEHQAFVTDKLRAGWAPGAIKDQLRRQFGEITNKDCERFLKVAKGIFLTAIETEAEQATALELYRLWTDVWNIAYGQLRTRERFHQSLGIPKPAEMLGLPRDWGKTTSGPERAVVDVVEVLKQITTACEVTR